MLFFKVSQYVEKEKANSNPDFALRFFDFDGYERDWISPYKKREIDAQGHISLADAAKNSFIKLSLPKSSRSILTKMISKYSAIENLEAISAEFAREFFNVLLDNKFDADCRETILAFIALGRAICANPNNRMDLSQTAKMMAPCFITPIFGEAQNPDEIRKFSSLFISMLEACLDLPEEAFNLLVDGTLIQKPSKKSSFLRLFGGKKQAQAQMSDDDLPIASSSQVDVSKSESSGSCSIDCCSTKSDSRASFASSDGEREVLDDGAQVELTFEFSRMKLKYTPVTTIKELRELVRVNAVSVLRDFFSTLDNPTQYFRDTRWILGRSLLHEAVLAQKPDVISLLREFGCEISLQDSHDKTPLHYAANWPKFSKSFCKDSLKELFEFEGAFLAAKLKKDSNGLSPIKLAKENDIGDMFESCRKPLRKVA